jgi:pimeloyl-ACP methyl ester carboxylesterase
MTRRVEMRIEVSSAVASGEALQLAATIVLPEPEQLAERPIVCFAKPSGGYSRGYFTHDLPGPTAGAQADFHVARGWIFVAIDNLGGGDSSVPSEQTGLSAPVVAAQAAESEILLRLANGLVEPGYPPISQPVVLGIGQSTGGMLAIVQQARHRPYDGIALLGFSAVQSQPPTPPGQPPVVTAWFARDIPAHSPAAVINAEALAAATAGAPQDHAWAALTWGFHYDDVPAEVIEQDMAHYEQIVRSRTRGEGTPSHPYESYATPDAARYVLTPGVVATEAAAITVPVLSAMGVRDMVVDPLGEARAFRSAPSFDLFICPRLGHMHNFGGTRVLFWERIHRFGEWIAAFKAAKG